MDAAGGFNPMNVASFARAVTRALLFAVVLTTPALAEAPATRAGIAVQEFTLPNGMRWLLFERHDAPTVSVGWVAHVGSVNEREGITGISHLFEHMMFKGTRTIGTKDIEADLRLLAEQDAVREEMRAELSKMRAAYRRGEIDDIMSPEAQTPRYRELAKRVEELVQMHPEEGIKDELDQLTTKRGV